MEALTLIPRLPAFFLVLLLVAAFLFLWRCHWNYSRHLWGGSFYLANRLIAAAILIFCLYHPSLRSSQPFLDKKVLAVARDTSLSMTIPDAGENVSRGQATNFLLSDLELTGFLEDHFDVHWYDFDSSVTPAQSPIYDVNSKTEGPLTAIRDAMKQIASRTSPGILAGIVLLSDGVENSDTAPAYLPPVPVYSIGVGSTDPPPIIDREVQKPVVPDRVTVNSRVEVSVTLRCLGTEPMSIPLTLTLSNEDGSNEKTVASATLTFTQSGESRLSAMGFVPSATGRFRLTASAPARDEEPLKDNNSRAVYIDVTDPDIPVLYLEGKPRFEFKFFKRALESDEFVQPTSIMKIGPNRFLAQVGSQSASEETSKLPTDLSAFKVIVLGDIAPSVLGETWLRELVTYVEKGGGLLFLGSQGIFGPAGASSPLTPLLPYETKDAPVRFHPGNFTLETSRQGRIHSLFGESLQRFDPPVASGAFSFPVLKSGASVLAYLKRDSFRTPGVLVQRYGGGRVALTAMAAAWPWELRKGAMGDRTTYFSQFWRQTVRWLAGLEEEEADQEAPIAVRTDCHDYYAGEPVRLTAFVSRDAFDRPPALTARFETTNGERFSFTLDRTATGNSYRYTTEYRSDQTGDFNLRVRAHETNPKDGAEAESMEETVAFTVKRSAREWERCGLNESFLKNLSRRTGGRYFPLERARDIQAALPTQRSTRTRFVEREIWNTPWLLALLSLLLSAEWAIRRRYERLKPEDL